MSKTICTTRTSSGIGKATAKKFQSKDWNMITTIFIGNSFDFQSNTTMYEYQEIVAKVSQAFASVGENASTPEMVVEVIYNAAIDNTNKMSYRISNDTDQLLEARKTMGEDVFIQNIKNQFQF